MRLASDLSIVRGSTSSGQVPLAPIVAAALGSTDRVGTPRTGWERRFDGLAASVQGVVSLADETDAPLGEADAVVVPMDWYWARGPSWATRPDQWRTRRSLSLARRARRAGRPLVVFFGGDRSCDRVPLPGAIVFREGGYRSHMTDTDVAMPAFAEDLLAEYCDGAVVERTRGARPVVGFCGLARRRSGLNVWMRLALYHAVVFARERRLHPSPYLGENLRTTALAHLVAHSDVDTNLVVRESSTFFRDASPSELVDVRREYVENLIHSDYVLCVRGSGNYSYRLYETLSLGRIPVLIDTDCALPFADEIDWRRHCVWVDADGIDQVAARVSEFHRRISPDEFIELQHANRKLWIDRLSPEGFFSQFERLVTARRAQQATTRSLSHREKGDVTWN